MKTLLKSGFVLALGLLLYGGSAQAQVRVNINAPYWGPAVPPNVQYYYIPEIDGYYDLYSQSYLFFDPAYGAWVSSPVLPRVYAAYDPRFFHPVAIQYVGRQPWGYLRDHRQYCDRWGVRPGRYYGSNWPGRGYVVAPRGGYGPGYYGNRPYGQGGYAQNGYRDNRNPYNGREERNDRYDRDNRDDRNDRNDNRYERNDNTPNNNQGGRDDRGGYAPRNEQPGPGAPPQVPGGYGGGRRGRVL
ncbi:hypothetical protein ACFPAF_09920 [Hymenobacter endophyticus]|uniref:DUF3300 domain-containing protein n=1 Tax=Hymenobacter endophyticus TaxID=3076335 RepID=A0ABU3TH60_9BACT|nr:hypothetical protein [Hymenobacter endophyticus]MDU0370709.1 hypothetical protein [Hymenobacter endophyticus]